MNFTRKKIRKFPHGFAPPLYVFLSHAINNFVYNFLPFFIHYLSLFCSYIRFFCIIALSNAQFFFISFHFTVKVNQIEKCYTIWGANAYNNVTKWKVDVSLKLKVDSYFRVTPPACIYTQMSDVTLEEGNERMHAHKRGRYYGETV